VTAWKTSGHTLKHGAVSLSFDESDNTWAAAYANQWAPTAATPRRALEMLIGRLNDDTAVAEVRSAIADLPAQERAWDMLEASETVVHEKSLAKT